MLTVLTPRRLPLLKTLNETPGSIPELARRLKRGRNGAGRDVQVLERYGVVEVSERPLPAHGRQKWVAPISRDIQLTAHL